MVDGFIGHGFLHLIDEVFHGHRRLLALTVAADVNALGLRFLVTEDKLERDLFSSGLHGCG